MTELRAADVSDDVKALNPELFAEPPSATVAEGGSALEERFLALWQAVSFEPLAREYAFHPSRHWRFDFAHLETGVAIEIEGGVWVQGRHTRPAGFIGDCEKYNAATLLGWRVFRFTGEMLTAAAVVEAARLVQQGGRQ
jgi:hypothetical protein